MMESPATRYVAGAKQNQASNARGSGASRRAHPGTATGSLAPPERGEGCGEGNLARKQVASSPRPSNGTIPIRNRDPLGGLLLWGGEGERGGSVQMRPRRRATTSSDFGLRVSPARESFRSSGFGLRVSDLVRPALASFGIRHSAFGRRGRLALRVSKKLDERPCPVFHSRRKRYGRNQFTHRAAQGQIGRSAGQGHRSIQKQIRAG